LPRKLNQYISVCYKFLARRLSGFSDWDDIDSGFIFRHF
jgi:hypothetical protein